MGVGVSVAVAVAVSVAVAVAGGVIVGVAVGRRAPVTVITMLAAPESTRPSLTWKVKRSVPLKPRLGV